MGPSNSTGWMIISPSRDFIIQNPEKFRRLQFPAGSKRPRLTRRESFSALTEANFLDSPREIADIGANQWNRPYFSGCPKQIGSIELRYGTAGTLATGSWVSTFRLLGKAKIRAKTKYTLNGQLDLSETKGVGAW